MKMLDVNDEPASKLLVDGKFHLEDGRTYPVFTQYGTGKDKINCNISDLLIPRNTRDALKHVASLGHQHRLHDNILATTTLRKCVKEYGLVIRANDSVSMDEDETPPGCEELQSWSHPTHKMSSCLKSHCKSVLIGLEYVVEVNPDRDMSCTSHSFYICLLCEKRSENLDNILKHIQSSAHRIFYLKKYFPRAHSLFLQADSCVENWPLKIHEYLETIASRIETFNGRLQILSCHRTQWEVKSQLFRIKIGLGTHFIETPDLFYDDIASPFTETKSGKRAKDGKPEFFIAPRLGLTDNAKMEKADQCTVPVEKGRGTTAIEEAITLSSDESILETDSETCERSVGVAALRVPSRTDSCRTTWRTKAREMLRPRNVQGKSISVDKQESPAEIPVCQSVECDEVVIVEEQIVQKDMKSASNALNRFVSRSMSRRHSQSSKRLRSVCSSMSRDTLSRSRSRSPKRLRSSHSSDGRPRNHHRCNTDVQHSSTSNARSEYEKERHQDLVRRSGRDRENPEKQRKENNNNNNNRAKKVMNEIHLRKKVEQKLNAFKEAVNRKQQIYKERPQDHPRYTVEWEMFWKRRFSELEKQGKNPYMHDFKREWFKFWFKRMQGLYKKEIEAKKTELMSKYGLANDETDQDYPREGNASDSNSDGQRLLQFSWEKISNETKSTADLKKGSDSEGSKIKNTPPNVQQPIKIPAVVDHPLVSPTFEELHILHKSKDISVVGGSTSRSASNRTSCDPTLLQVLRMLVALEDSLGSLGPSITKLLTRALSAERCRTGSSSEFLQENATFVVDLLDTSKEKLKGLLCAGLLDGVKAAATSQAVESVTRFLERSVPLIHCGQTTNRPASVDIASLIHNLQEAGLLRPIQSATVIPATLSSVQPSNIGNMEEIPSNDSSKFITGVPSLSAEDTISSNPADKSEFGSFDQFTGKELKILIVNFRTLTASQKRDLIHCLRHVEETYADKNSMCQSQSVSSTPASPSSPSPQKHRADKNDKRIHPHSPEARYPSILKMTGLSSDDLENYGIPLKQLDPIRPSRNPNFTRKTEELVALTNPRSPRINSVHPQSPIGQSHQWTLSDERSGTLTLMSVEKQPTREDRIEPSPDQPILCTFEKREDGSFCNALLDPRRNRALQVQKPSPMPELSHSTGRPNDPIIIPTSPVLSRWSQQSGMRQSSDSRLPSSSSKTLNPFSNTGNPYW
ncbi:uncharacterized protein LOC130702849 isoform X2 [Daphnia carinata]|uniref:uncharacterized protein LOC130702849 isoform X2 n=1 Tax=Daphnia carinata TaxID=120202 RepID=UPI0028690143|nr:uncharacterized protein LOC130702849 isoform X2 [Daphnia carinata]